MGAKFLNMKMDENLKFELKALAVKKRITLREVIVMACEDLLKKKKKEEIK